MSDANKKKAVVAALDKTDPAELPTPSFAPDPVLASRHEQILASLSDWVWEVDSNGFITYSNPAVQNIMGYSPADLEGNSFYNLVLRSDAADARKLINREWDHKEYPQHVRHHFISKDRRKILLETSGSKYFDSTSNSYCTRFVSRAVVMGRMNENSKTRMSVYAANFINEAIAIMNTELIITYVNDPFTTLFGYSYQEIVGQPMTILGTDEAMENFLSSEENSALQARRNWYGEVMRKGKDGLYIPCMLSARATHDRNGNFTGYIGSHLDLREARLAGREQNQLLKKVINTVCNTIEHRSLVKTKHQEGVTDLGVSIALEMGKDMHFIEGLSLACQLHDLGEMFIPPEIVNQVGRLSESDLQMIKTHPRKAYEILSPLNLPWPVADAILQHHERLNGSGYPNQLRGDEIMLEARIIAVADVAETMLTDRPYRKACTVDQCINELQMNKGLLYDPDVVDICVTLIGGGI